jgi:hypothetical protein
VVHKVLSQAIVVEIVIIATAAVVVESVLGENEFETSLGCEILDIIEVSVKFMNGTLKVLGISPLVQMRRENDFAIRRIVTICRRMPFPIAGDPIWPIHDHKWHVKGKMLTCLPDCLLIK